MFSARLGKPGGKRSVQPELVMAAQRDLPDIEWGGGMLGRLWGLTAGQA